MTKLAGRLALLGLFAFSSIQATAGLEPKEGEWILSLRGGIAPAVFNEQAKLTSTTHLFGSTITEGSTDISTSTVSRKSKRAQFSKMYNMPFHMAADFGLMWSDKLEWFLNLDYSHTCGKNVEVAGNIGSITANTSWNFRDHSALGMYFGGRWYFKPYRCILPFIGSKIGVRTNAGCSGQRRQSVALLANPAIDFTRGGSRDCMTLSGGIQMGCEWMIAEGYYMTMMTEMIGSPYRSLSNAYVVHQTPTAAVTPATGNLGFASQVTSKPRGLISFPITWGLRVRM